MTCNTCEFWKRDKFYEDNKPYQWGFCHEIRTEIDINLDVGWDGATVRNIETPATFGCNLWRKSG